MAGKRLVLVLALASLLAVNASHSGSFTSWLANKSTAKTQGAYEEVEVTSTCLQLIANKNCRSMRLADGSCTHTEAKVACCKSADEGDKYSSSLPDLFAEVKSIGTCTFYEDLFGEGKEVRYQGSDAVKVGKFEVTCELDEDSDKCGSPLCEGMVLQGKGTILKYNNVAFMHDLVETQKDDECLAMTLVPGASNNKTPAKLQAADYGTQWVVGEGHIYAGFFHVFSRHHKVSQKTGEFQMVKHVGDASRFTRSSELPSKCFVAKDGAIALDFFKSGDYY